MNIKNILKRGNSVVVGYDNRIPKSWVVVVLLTLVLLFVSIVFNVFFLFGVENTIAATPIISDTTASQTIDRVGLQTVLSNRTALLANFPSAKEAALKSVDPSK